MWKPTVREQKKKALPPSQMKGEKNWQEKTPKNCVSQTPSSKHDQYSGEKGSILPGKKSCFAEKNPLFFGGIEATALPKWGKRGHTLYPKKDTWGGSKKRLKKENSSRETHGSRETAQPQSQIRTTRG